MVNDLTIIWRHIDAGYSGQKSECSTCYCTRVLVTGTCCDAAVQRRASASKFEFLTALTSKMTVLRVSITFSPVEIYRHYREPSCLHIQRRR